MQNGVVPTNPTKFALNYLDHIGVIDIGVHGFGCNFNSWVGTSYMVPPPIITNDILKIRPKIYANITIRNMSSSIGGWTNFAFGFRYSAAWNNSAGSLVTSGVVILKTGESVHTIDNGWGGLNEYMYDFSSALNSSGRSNYQIWALIFAGQFTWSDGDDSHSIRYELPLANCNMWLQR